MAPPSVRRPSQADNSIPVESDEEVSGVVGELPDRIETRLRRANITLGDIRNDFTKHAETDEKSFSEVKGSVVRLEGQVTMLSTQHTQHAFALGEIGGKVSTLLSLQEQQMRLQLETVASAREDKKTERDDNAKVALAKTEASTKIWLKLIAAIIVIAGIVVSAMVGHSVK